MNNFTYIDIALITIIGLSTIIAFFRGFITEVLSLLVWIIAFWGAAYFSENVAEILPDLIKSITQGKIDLSVTEGTTEELLVSILSYIVTFLCILFIAGLVNLGISLLIRFLKISFFDRILGTFFGLLRGWLIVSILSLFAINTGFNSASIWQQSHFKNFLDSSANTISKFLPTKFLQQINIGELSKLLQSDLQTPQAQSIQSATPDIEKTSENTIAPLEQ